MGSLTLVPETLAKTGYRFRFRGANDGEECADCPVRQICFRLEPGQEYQVTGLRQVVHPCNLHEEGRVRVCEVEPVPMETTLQQKHLRGTAAHWEPVPCGYPECGNWKLCHPVAAQAGAKYTITERLGPVECPMHYQIERVRLQPFQP